MPKHSANLFVRPDTRAMSLVDRLRYYADQIADFEADPTGSARALLEASEIRKVLIEASEALTK
jgi:hypothetical protein